MDYTGSGGTLLVNFSTLPLHGFDVTVTCNSSVSSVYI